jgi:hypothetical protein
MLESKKKKIVTFEVFSTVVFIPSRNEYVKISDELWYKQNDYDEFLRQYFFEEK